MCQILPEWSGWVNMNEIHVTDGKSWKWLSWEKKHCVCVTVSTILLYSVILIGVVAFVQSLIEAMKGVKGLEWHLYSFNKSTINLETFPGQNRGRGPKQIRIWSQRYYYDAVKNPKHANVYALHVLSLVWMVG